MNRGPQAVVPHVSKEALDCGRTIDECLHGFLAESYGIERVVPTGESKLPFIFAQMVQLAIDAAMEKVDA
jgi:hypothetical protein